MRRTANNIPKRIFIGLIVLSVGLVAIHLTLQYVNLYLLNERFGLFYELTNRFDLDDEVSVPTWVSQIMFLLLAAVAALSVRLSSQKGVKQLWALLAVAAVIGSVDEGAGLHELALQSLHNIFLTDQSATLTANAWWIVLPFIVLSITWFLYKTTQLLSRRTVMLLGVGLGAYFSGAVAIDLITNMQTDSLFFKQGFMVAVEEGLELLGLSVLIYAVADNIYENHSTRLNVAWGTLKHEHDRLETNNVKTSSKKLRT